MHARKTTIKSSPGQIDKAREIVEGQVIPRAKDMSGFRGGYWLVDDATGDGITFTFFDSKDALDTSAAAATQIRTGAVGQIPGGSVESVEHYEVALSTGEKVHDRASHARVLHFEGDAKDADRAIKAIEENVLPGLKQVPGFLGGFWLLDRDSARGVGVTLFDGEASIAASRERAAALRNQTAEGIGGKVGEFREYEVMARTSAPAGAAAG